MDFFTVWLVSCFICAIAGTAMLDRYDKGGTGFLLGGFLGPIGLIIAWTMRDNAKMDEAASQIVQSQRTRKERECPFCAELILAKARACKHCGRDVEPVEQFAPAKTEPEGTGIPCPKCGSRNTWIYDRTASGNRPCWICNKCDHPWAVDEASADDRPSTKS